MAKKKSYRNMDRTSAGVASWLDQLREAHRKKQARGKFGSTKPPGGKFH